MAARFDHERIRGIIGSIFKAVADIFFVLETLVHDTVGQDQEVRGKGEGPGAGNRCFKTLVNDMQRGGAGLTQHFWNRGPDYKGGTHDCGGGDIRTTSST